MMWKNNLKYILIATITNCFKYETILYQLFAVGEKFQYVGLVNMELNGFWALWESFVRGNNAQKNHLDIEGFWMNLLRRRLD
jgi:hypothetical protein